MEMLSFEEREGVVFFIGVVCRNEGGGLVGGSRNVANGGGWKKEPGILFATGAKE